MPFLFIFIRGVILHLKTYKYSTLLAVAIHNFCKNLNSMIEWYLWEKGVYGI